LPRRCRWSTRTGLLFEMKRQSLFSVGRPEVPPDRRRRTGAAPERGASLHARPPWCPYAYRSNENDSRLETCSGHFGSGRKVLTYLPRCTAAPRLGRVGIGTVFSSFARNQAMTLGLPIPAKCAGRQLRTLTHCEYDWAACPPNALIGLYVSFGPKATLLIPWTPLENCTSLVRSA